MNLLIFVFLAVLSPNIQVSFGQLFPRTNKNAQFDILQRDTPSIDTSKNTEVVSKKTETSVLRCGHVSSQSNGGVIFYKPFEQVVDNERCVWIIAAPRAVGYTVNVQYLGSPTNEPGSGQELILTGVKWYLNDFSFPSINSVRPTSPGILNITYAQVLLVTFMSSTVESTSSGFALDYKEILGEGDTISEKTTHHLFGATQFGFKFPVESATYDNKESAIFVFVPSNNIRGTVSSTVWYEGNTICPDFINIYRFNSTKPTSEERWQDYGRYCGSREAETVHDDIILGVFVTNDKDVGTGFSFHYATCQSS